MNTQEVHPFEEFEQEYGRPPELAARDAVVAGTEIDRMLGHIERLQDELAEKKAIAEARKAAVDDWFDAEAARIAFRCLYLTGQIQSLEHVLDYRGRASYQLPNGKVGSQALPEGIDILDNKAALAFASENGFARLEPKVGKTELLRWFKETGELPDGCEHRPASRRFYIETAKGRFP